MRVASPGPSAGTGEQAPSSGPEGQTGGSVRISEAPPVGSCGWSADVENANVGEYPYLDCSLPHDSEYLHSFSTALAEDGADFPGEEALFDEAVQVCSPIFEDYVGRPLRGSGLRFHLLVATEPSWNQGDRESVCLIETSDLSIVIGTFEGYQP